ADVECFTLMYCQRGTGTALLDHLGTGPLTGHARWADYDPDGSGLPNLELWDGGMRAWGISIMPHVTSAAIHPGDTFQLNFPSGSDVVTLPASLSTYFVTTPAISSWSNGTTTTTISYPVTDPNAAVLSAPSGSLALTLWRPQRAPIPGSGETD